MVELQVEILKYIKAGNSVICSDVINNFLNLEDAKAIEYVIKNFIHSGDIKSSDINNLTTSRLSLTPRGIDTYLHEVNNLKKSEKENKRYLITTAIAVIGLIKAFLPEIINLLSLIADLFSA